MSRLRREFIAMIPLGRYELTMEIIWQPSNGSTASRIIANHFIFIRGLNDHLCSLRKFSLFYLARLYITPIHR